MYGIVTFYGAFVLRNSFGNRSGSSVRVTVRLLEISWG